MVFPLWPLSVRRRCLTPALARHPLQAAALCALLVASLVAPTFSASGLRASGADQPGRITWQATPWYLHGANIPWFNWGCDFGCGATGGVSDPAVRMRIEPAFAQLRDSGIHLARWWVFEGDAWQITRDSSGAPSGIDPRVFTDIDAALDLAAQYDLYYEFTLFHGPANVPSAWLTDPVQRGKLASVLSQLFLRYKGHPRILAYDLMNEPEWDIWNGKIAQEPVQATLKALADAVHASSTAYATVGSAMLDGLPMWKGIGLDFYQAHWYDYMSSGNWCARCTDYAAVQLRYGLDRPLVIGEFYAGGDVDALQRFQDWRHKGYAGAFAWSLFWDRTQDKMQIDLNAARQFGALYADTGPRGAVLATATPMATATATATATVSPTATPLPLQSPVPSASPTQPMPTQPPATSTVTPTHVPTSTAITHSAPSPTSPPPTATRPGRRNGQQ